MDCGTTARSSVGRANGRNDEGARADRVAHKFPMMTLNPVLRVDTQMIEAVQAHRKIQTFAKRSAARRNAGRNTLGLNRTSGLEIDNEARQAPR